MGFTKRGNIIRRTHITGPTHNLLGLELTDFLVQGEPEMEALEIPGPVRLNAADVSCEVLAGVAEANLVFGTNFSVLRIQFVPSDTGPYKTLRMMAASIVEYHINHR